MQELRATGRQTRPAAARSPLSATRCFSGKLVTRGQIAAVGGDCSRRCLNKVRPMITAQARTLPPKTAAIVQSYAARIAYTTVVRCEIPNRLQVAHEMARAPSRSWMIRRICGRYRLAQTPSQAGRVRVPRLARHSLSGSGSRPLASRARQKS